MEPATPPDPAAQPAASVSRAGLPRPGRWQALRRVSLVALCAVAVLLAVLVAALGWQLRPEARRQHATSALSAAFGRPVEVGAVEWSWQGVRNTHAGKNGTGRGDDAGAEVRVILRDLRAPAQAMRRGYALREVTLVLQPSLAAWWRAWRQRAPWPVVSLHASGLQSASLAGAADDGLGEWTVARLDAAGVVADRVAPRVRHVQFQGTWRRSPLLQAVPVRASVEDLAVAGGGVSLHHMQWVVAGARLGFSQFVASPESVAFNMEAAPLNLREWLPALGIAIPATADPAVLSRVAWRADCVADAMRAGCSSLLLKVDATTFAGEIGRSAPPPGSVGTVGSVGGGDPAPWWFHLHADHLDLDRYLPPDDPRDPPFNVPWGMANVWPLEGTLNVDELRLAGLRMQGANVAVRFGPQGLAVETP